VLPLVRRIRALRLAAERVGDAHGYRPLAGARDGDELDALGAILDATHARIRSDAQLLEEQRNALERHLIHVAHDMRTPLAAVQVALEYVADSAPEPAMREVLTGALRDIVYLAALTHNLRLASQLRTGWDPTREVVDVDFADMVCRIGARAQMLARRRGMELAVSVPDETVTVRCNMLAVEQALTNVVDNAVAYGDAHGHVAVVLARSDAGDAFRLEIRDDGPGVPPEELPRLTERTFRSDQARQRNPRGSGLGLAITAEVCARFGWTLAFASLELRGLLVTIGGTTAKVEAADGTPPADGLSACARDRGAITGRG